MHLVRLKNSTVLELVFSASTANLAGIDVDDSDFESAIEDLVVGDLNDPLNLAGLSDPLKLAGLSEAKSKNQLLDVLP